MEQVVFLLILGAVAFIRWLYEKSQEARARSEMEREEEQGSRHTVKPTPSPRDISEAERMRRFMEALGIPQGEAPPPVPSFPRPVVSPRLPPVIPPTPPPVPKPVAEAFEVQRTQRPESSMERKIAEAEAATKRSEEEARKILAQRVPGVPRVAAALPQKASRGRGRFGANVRHRLHDPQLTAESIVLAEILGPPRALAPHRSQPSG